MRFNKHYDVEGLHAFLSPSKYHWINYDDEKLERVFTARLASQRGNDLHKFALDAIRLGIRLPDIPKTMNLYVNDAIGFRMTPEQVLYFSPNAFGTADAIAFRNNFLRIHDLKTGLRRTSEHQLEVYAAYFCLEYRYKPYELDGIELRIYQNDEVRIFEADPESIAYIMKKTVEFDKRLDRLREEASW